MRLPVHSIEARQLMSCQSPSDFRRGVVTSTPRIRRRVKNRPTGVPLAEDAGNWLVRPTDEDQQKKEYPSAEGFPF